MNSIAAEERGGAVAETFDGRLLAAFARGTAFAAAFAIHRPEATTPTAPAAEIALTFAGEFAFGRGATRGSAARLAALVGLAGEPAFTRFARFARFAGLAVFARLARFTLFAETALPAIAAVLTAAALFAAGAFEPLTLLVLAAAFVAPLGGDLAVLFGPVHLAVLALFAVFRLEIVGLIEALLELRRDVLRLHGAQDAEIVLRMLEIVLRHDAIAR